MSTVRRRNPAPAAIIGTSILGGIGAGTGFAIANAATVPVVRRAEQALKHNPRRSHEQDALRLMAAQPDPITGTAPFKEVTMQNPRNSSRYGPQSFYAVSVRRDGTGERTESPRTHESVALDMAKNLSYQDANPMWGLGLPALAILGLVAYGLFERNR